MTELERSLVTLGRELEYPPAPDLARVVEWRLAGAGPADAAGRRFGLRSRRAVVLAFAVLLLTSGTVVAAVPGARNAVLEFFGLRGATVERRERLPATPPPSGRLDLGPRTTLEAARRELAFTPLVPESLGNPDAVHVGRGPPGGELALVYGGTRPRLLVTEFRGDLHPAYAGKITTEAAAIERVSVDGDRGIWIAGAPHLFFYRDPDGRFREETLRLAQNALLLERGQVLVRIEGRFDKDAAVRIARSLR